MTTGIWLLWPRPPLAIAFIKEHECALKETSGTQMVNISKKKNFLALAFITHGMEPSLQLFGIKM